MPNSIGKGLRSRGRNSPTRPAMGTRLGHSEPYSQTSARTRIRQTLVTDGTAVTT